MEIDRGNAREYGTAAEIMAHARAEKAGGALRASVEGSLARLSKWAARVDAQAIFSLDGCRRMVAVQKPGGGLENVLRAGRAVVDNRGEVLLTQNIEACNYRAEFAAQLDALKSTGATRIIIVFDASSPVDLLIKYIRSGNERKRRMLLAEWADEWWGELLQFEAVVFLWQTSHVDEPINDWADEWADKAVEDGVTVGDPGLNERVSFASGTFTGVERGIRTWALVRANAATRA